MTKRDELHQRLHDRYTYQRECQPGMKVMSVDIEDVPQLLFWLRPRARPEPTSEATDDRP